MAQKLGDLALLTPGTYDFNIWMRKALRVMCFSQTRDTMILDRPETQTA